MTNIETISNFLDQKKTYGNNSNKTIFWEHEILYSYGYHFPLAKLLDNNTIIVNSSNTTITTNKQRSYLYRLINNKYTVFAVPFRNIKISIHSDFRNDLVYDVLNDYIKETIEDIKLLYKRARKYKTHYKNQYTNFISMFTSLCNYYKIPLFPALSIKLID